MDCKGIQKYVNFEDMRLSSFWKKCIVIKIYIRDENLKCITATQKREKEEQIKLTAKIREKNKYQNEKHQNTEKEIKKDIIEIKIWKISTK